MSPATPTEPVWRVVDAAGFDSRQWGDDIVLYVAATGETHALGSANSSTLALLLEHAGMAHTARQWLHLMTDEPGFDSTNEQQDQADLIAIQDALNDLHRIGVVLKEPI